MKKLRRLLQPAHPLWVDIFFLVVPLLMLAPSFYNSYINPKPPERAYEGNFVSDGSIDSIGGWPGFALDTIVIAFLIFFLSIPVVAAIRIFYRVKRKKVHDGKA